MHSINLANSKKRDARASFESAHTPKSIRFAMKDGNERHAIKLLKSDLEVSKEALMAKYSNDYRAFGEILIAGDPEMDSEQTSRIISNSSHGGHRADRHPF
ncbi:MAG: hypothetical protein LBD73_04090 [Deferribacteraceae bacterium]|jgi:hypothetical protein|nr:hypothetical protein [Deferribacteraceae bacterium]